MNYRVSRLLFLIVIIAKKAHYQSLIDFFFIILHPKCAWYARWLIRARDIIYDVWRFRRD